MKAQKKVLGEVTFPCTEKGCRGTILVDRRKPTKQERRTYHHRTLQCPKCGRLYWPETKEPVIGEGPSRVYRIKGDLVYRKEGREVAQTNI